MNRRSGYIVLSLCFALISCSRGPGTDEEAVLGLLDEGVRLVEEHDVKGLIKRTTTDFSLEPGGQDRDETKRILLWAFMHYGDFKILHPRPQVDLSSEEVGEASVRVPFLVVKREKSLPDLKGLYEDPKGWLQQVGEHADLYRVELQLVKENGDWLVRSAHLEGFTGLGFSD